MIKKVWDNFEKWILIVVLGFSCCLVMFQVIMRYVFGSALSWSEELARFLFIWEIWLGIAYATKMECHLRITMIRDRIPGKAKEILELIITVGWFCFGAFLVYKGVDMCMRVAGLGQESAALRIPMQYVYFSIPFGALLMDIHLIEIFVRKVKELSMKKEAGTNE